MEDDSMSLELFRRIMIHDKEGNLVKDSGLQPSSSYVIQFLELIYGWLDYVDVTATDVDNAESVIFDALASGVFHADYYGTVSAGAGVDDYGIVVGINTGETAEDNENYKLDTKILHGSEEADKLDHQAVTFVAARVVGANIDFDISRAFINDSGGTITVKEIGLICKNVAITKYHLLMRDVVSDEAVADDYTLTVVYTMRSTV